MASRRGGASAPQHCKRQLSTCFTGTVRSGGSLRTAGRACMKQFNNCRLGGKRRKSRRKGRR